MVMCMSGAWIVHTMKYLPRFENVWLKLPFLRVPARNDDGPLATATGAEHSYSFEVVADHVHLVGVDAET